MKKDKLKYGRRPLICAAATIMAVCMMYGCGKEKKISYGKEPGVATGTVDFSKDKPEINIDNIISPIGTDIDYTSMLDFAKGDEDYSVQVNASGVKYDKPGTYNVEYKFKYGDSTYTDNVKVTITDDENITVGAVNQDQIISSQPGVPSEISPGNSGNGQPGETGQNPGGQPGQSGEQEPGGIQPEQGTTRRELITDPDNQLWQDSDIPNAVIELLSGDVVTISCSTSKYIVATRTDKNNIMRNGQLYERKKLVVEFNTGATQVLETVETLVPEKKR